MTVHLASPFAQGVCLSAHLQVPPFSQHRPRRAVQVARRISASATEEGPIARAVNWLSVAVKNSPANNVKQAIAKAQAGDYDEGQVAARLQSYIEDNTVVVFSWTSCPFCKKAKARPSFLRAALPQLVPQFFEQSLVDRLGAKQPSDVICLANICAARLTSVCSLDRPQLWQALLQDVGADFLAVELDQMGSEGSALRCELAKVCTHAFPS